MDYKTEFSHIYDIKDENINSTCLMEEEVENKISAVDRTMLECSIDVVKNEFVSHKEDEELRVQDMLKDNTEAKINYSTLIEEEVVKNKLSATEQAVFLCPVDVVKGELFSDKEDQDICMQNMLKADGNCNYFEEFKPDEDVQSSDDNIQLIQFKNRKKKTNKFTNSTFNEEKLDSGKPKHSKESKPRKEQNPKLSGHQLIATSLELKCDICQTQVSTWRELWQHFVLAAHSRTPYIKCCGTVYEKEQAFVDHLQWHNNPDAFKCQLCGENLNNFRDLRAHISTFHPDNVDLYECEHCFKQFQSFSIYNNHLRTHSKDSDAECRIRNKRNKMTTQTQFAQMVQLLEKKPELARSFQNGSHKLNTKEEWNKIAEKLNALGPPSRQGFKWFKVWADYKCKLKKRLIQCKADSRSTGSGSYKQYHMSPIENAAFRLLQLNSTINMEVDDIDIHRTMEIQTERIVEEHAYEESGEEEAPTTSNIRKQSKSIQSKNGVFNEQLKVKTDISTDGKQSLNRTQSQNKQMHKIKNDKLKLQKSLRSARKCIAVEEFDEQEDISRRRLRDSSNVLEMPTNQFVENFRVSKDIFILLLRMLEGKWASGFRSTAIRPDVKLSTFLRFVATGSYQQTVGNDWVSSTAQSSTSRIIRESLNLFEEWICPEWIKMPSSEEERSIMDAFFDIAGFPGVIGCVDGTHIRIKSPGDDRKQLYYNRKANYSINAMMVCDHKMTIMYIDARHPGANGDSFIWEQSPLDQRLQSSFENGNRNSWILGDGGYKLKPFLMTPFRDPKDAAERLYNKKHATTRNIVERCIALLKNRFRCLIGVQRLHYEPEIATQIINACCAVHNMCIKYKCTGDLVGTFEVEETNVSDDFNGEFDPIALAMRRGIAINL